MVYSELHVDQEGNGLFVGGRGQNKARVAERRGIGCFFSLFFFLFFIHKCIFIRFLHIPSHLWLKIEDTEMKCLKSSMVQIKVAYI